MPVQKKKCFHHTLTTGLWLWVGDAEPERAARLKLHSMCQKKNRILAMSGEEWDLAPCGRTQVLIVKQGGKLFLRSWVST